MKLWRLVHEPFLALDDSGPEKHGARWTSPGRPVVNFVSEAGLAVLVVFRYLPRDLIGVPDDFVLGWTETDETPEDIPFTEDPVESDGAAMNGFHRADRCWRRSGRRSFPKAISS